jgi:hypothetical protein
MNQDKHTRQSNLLGNLLHADPSKPARSRLRRRHSSRQKYQQSLVMELAGLAPWLHRNLGSFVDYKQKKSNHQDKRRWIIKAKEVRSLQTTWIDILTTYRQVIRAVLLSSSSSSVAPPKYHFFTLGFLKNKTRLIICVPRKSTHMSK